MIGLGRLHSHQIKFKEEAHLKYSKSTTR
ncbi:Uncharacterized protein BM_BM11280, partial [Brugia malayi]